MQTGLIHVQIYSVCFLLIHQVVPERCWSPRPYSGTSSQRDSTYWLSDLQQMLLSLYTLGKRRSQPSKFLFRQNHQSMFSIDVDSALVSELCNTSLFIWDPIMMTHQLNLKAVDRTFSGMIRSTLPFCGKGSCTLETVDKYCLLWGPVTVLRLWMHI